MATAPAAPHPDITVDIDSSPAGDIVQESVMMTKPPPPLDTVTPHAHAPRTAKAATQEYDYGHSTSYARQYAGRGRCVRA